MTIQKNIEKFYSLKGKYNSEFAHEKIAILNTILKTDFAKIQGLVNFHDALLFSKAFPDNAEFLILVNQILDKLKETILLNFNNTKLLDELKNSGIANTSIEASYNFDILRIMLQKFPFFLEFDSFGAEEETLFSVFQLIVNEAEYIAFTDENFNFKEWMELRFSRNAKDKFSQILTLIDESNENERIKTNLFSQLQMFVRINLNDKFSRSFLSENIYNNWCFYETTGMQNKIDFKNFIQQSLPPQSIEINKTQKRHLIDIAQIQLLSLLRELDAITYADDNSVEWVQLENGMSIALYYQKLYKRQIIESLIGCTVFKNGVPIAYCAFWIFGFTAKIAFNIFEAFRGGESKYIFCQVVRVAVQIFQIKKLEVDPYQFGNNNEEALNSGAYWFYHKLGFQSKDADLRKLGDKEYQKILKNKSHRTPISTLEKLATQSLECVLSPSAVPFLVATKYSLLMSKLIQEEFNGYASQIENKASKELLDVLEIKILSSNASLTETESFKKMSVLFYKLIPKIKEWTEADKAALFHLMKIKLAGSEKEYVLKFQQHKSLIYSMFEMV